MTSTLSIEHRLRELELTLGIHNKSDLSESSHDIKTRIDDIHDHYSKKLSSHGNGSLRNDLKQCEALEKELEPGSLLTYQMMSSSSTKNAPLLYRRQEILASKESFKKDMNQLALIRDLLLRKHQSNKSTFSESPIISSSVYDSANDPSMLQRLDTVTLKVSNVHERASKLVSRLDSLLDGYQQIMLAASEKVLLADEELHELGNK